jgi:hypothetical protein
MFSAVRACDDVCNAPASPPAHSTCPARTRTSAPRSLVHECFRVTGPLLSLVFRTEDVWQRCNQFIETAGLSIRVSPSHPYNAGKAGPGWGGGWIRGNVYDACRGYVVYCFCPQPSAHSLQPRRCPRGCRPRATRTPSRVHAAARSNTTRARSILCGRPRSRAVPASIACGSRGILWKRLVVGRAVATTPRADPRPLGAPALAAHPRPK